MNVPNAIILSIQQALNSYFVFSFSCLKVTLCLKCVSVFSHKIVFSLFIAEFTKQIIVIILVIMITTTTLTIIKKTFS